MQPTRSKKVIISVVSDLVTDQRVNRAALTLHANGFEVLVVGRTMRKSLSVEERTYKIKRFHLWFEKGPLFYASYNLRLFLFLLFNHADIYISNDLDTLFPNFIVSKIKKVKLVYDSHEYFTEVPELINRPFVRSIWKKIERRIFPRLKYVMTVNDSIAGFYSNEYKIPIKVVRNLPLRADLSKTIISRKDWGIPEDVKIFLFQGAGINIDRGAEEAIEAIRQVNGAVLLFIGSGDVLEQLKNKISTEELKSKIFFIPKQPFQELNRFTRIADYGLTLDKSNNLNYKYSLPNKLFDYIQSNLPVIATDLPEVKKIVEKYDVGLIIKSAEPVILAEAMNKMMSDENRLAQWKKNLNIAAGELCWENEQHIFLDLFTDDEGH